MTTTDGDSDFKQEKLESEIRNMDLKEEERDVDMDSIPVAESDKKGYTHPLSRTSTSTPSNIKRQSRSPTKAESMAQSPAIKSEDEEIVGGDIELKLEPDRPPKLQRKASHKIERRPPPLFFAYADKTNEATRSFSVLQDCVYANKYLGSTEHALECDCAEEWGKPPPMSFQLKPDTMI